MAKQIPATLLLGAATAATQIEGGDVNCNWYAWSLQGRVGNNESSLLGADHYRRYKEDIDIMADLGLQCYRMSLEWSRLEPECGVWSEEGFRHYRDELEYLQSKNIRVLVTLHHFSCPQWFQDLGGWLAKDAVKLFVRYCKKAVESYGDLVSEWCTINEPNVFANDTYMDGKYPPGHNGDMASYFKVSKTMALAHLELYPLIHRLRKEKGFPGETRVGFAHHLAHFVSGGRGLFARLGMFFIPRFFHEIYFKAYVEGRLIWPLGFRRPKGKGVFCDFIGINYYSRHVIQPSPKVTDLFGKIIFDPSLKEEQKNDLGWEIYPEGLYEVVKKTWQRYGLPIHITENGIPDARDEKRAGFIKQHLEQVLRLLEEGVDIPRYYYWSLLDNLEWNDGYGPRFGLVEVDYETMARKIRPSAEYYGQLCKTRNL